MLRVWGLKDCFDIVLGRWWRLWTGGVACLAVLKRWLPWLPLPPCPLLRHLELLSAGQHSTHSANCFLPTQQSFKIFTDSSLYTHIMFYTPDILYLFLPKSRNIVCDCQFVWLVLWASDYTPLTLSLIPSRKAHWYRILHCHPLWPISHQDDSRKHVSLILFPDHHLCVTSWELSANKSPEKPVLDRYWNGLPQKSITYLLREQGLSLKQGFDKKHCWGFHHTSV